MLGKSSTFAVALSIELVFGILLVGHIDKQQLAEVA